MTTYAYGPVSASERQFRLVTLQPGTFNDDICILLEIADLDSFDELDGSSDGDEDEDDDAYDSNTNSRNEEDDDVDHEEMEDNMGDSNADDDRDNVENKHPSDGSPSCDIPEIVCENNEQVSAIVSATTLDQDEATVAPDEGSSDDDDRWDENVGERIRTKTRNCIGYECLSYAWGEEQDPRTVYVQPSQASGNDDLIMITRNLEEALRHLRYEDEPRRFFIDAISIDQRNLAERSEQVTLMGAIYKRATVTTIWLGPAENDSDRGMRIANEIGRQITVDHKEGTMEQTDWAQWLWWHWNQPMTPDDKDKMALYHLLGRPWFSRLWVRQELALSRDPVVMCGHKIINWTSVSNCGFLLYISTATFRQGALDKEFSRRRWLLYRLCRVEQYGVFYKSLRNTNRDIGFKDPRDVIYAVTDLLPERERLEDLDLRPDYTKPVPQIYREVVLALAKRARQLNVITSCELASLKLQGLPSWVPDFSSQEHTFTTIAHHWSACAWISAQAEEVQPGILRVSAVRACTVKSIIETNRDSEELSQLDLVRTFQRALKNLDPDGPYAALAGLTNIEAFCLTVELGPLVDTYEQSSLGLLTLDQCVAVMRKLLNCEDVPEDDINIETVLQDAQTILSGRKLFVSDEGHFGLCPAASLPGDVVSVILGAEGPMILRPAAEGPDQWQVVGPAQVSGLMEGQAIYGPWEEGWQCWYSDKLPMIDQNFVAMRNTKKGITWDNPEVILKEKGFEVKEYIHYPHILEVDFEELRRKGVNIEKLDLV